MPFDETLRTLDGWIERNRQARLNHSPNQLRERQFREAFQRDKTKAMLDTERVLWALKDAGSDLDTSHGPICGYQLYCWTSYMFHTKKTESEIFQWAMRALDKRQRDAGRVKTSNGWEGIGAILPHPQNDQVPIDKLTEIDGEEVYIMAYKATTLPDGRGWRLLPEGEGDGVQDGVDDRREQTDPEVGDEAGVVLRSDDAGGVTADQLRHPLASFGPDDVPSRVLRRALERVTRNERLDPAEPGFVGEDEDPD